MTLPLVPVPTSLQWHEAAPVSLPKTATVGAPQHLAPAVAALLGTAEQHIVTDDGARGSGQQESSCAVVLTETDGDGEAYVLHVGESHVALSGARAGLLRGL